MNATQKKWWKESIAYQIYPRSFYDSNQDGVGDIRGIIEKLDYLEELGIDLIWISPVYQSPMKDNGYDISDYYSIDPLFGTNNDMEELIREAAARGMKIIMDLVANHCSSQHVWFQKAIRDPECEEAGYFIFRRTEDRNTPNNWRSNFGGSAWTLLPDGRYYLHTFDAEQPDLNWENPNLRQQLYEMMNWWLDKGIAGFRVDAITFIKKDLSFASRPAEIGPLYPIEKFQNFPGIDTFLKEMRQEVFEPHDCVTVAEAPGVPYEQLDDYIGDDGHFSMIFDFNWDHFAMEKGEKKSDSPVIKRWRNTIFKSQELIQERGWSPLFLENHDQPRCPNKFLERDQISRESITMLATLYFLLRGTPFIYQGQELGFTNYPISGLQDIYDTAAHGRYLEAVLRGEKEEDLLADLNENSRDHARTPFHWNDSEHGGFTKGWPWIPVHPDYKEVNAAYQIPDPDSVLSYYKKLIQLRKDPQQRDTLIYGSFSSCCTDYDKVIGYIREYENKKIVVLNNMSSEAVRVDLPLSCKEILLSNQAAELADSGKQSFLIKGYQSIVYLH